MMDVQAIRSLRHQGQHEAARILADRGLSESPQAREIIVFRAMTLHNLGRGKQAVEALLRVVAETADDPNIQEYSRAIEQYAQDVERTWP